MKRGKLIRITAIFFAFMLCFTILSRAADQTGVAVVSAERPENRMISHDIKATGRVVQNQDLAVITEADQRVKAIYVSEGDRVDRGDLLFEIDTSLLQEQILEQQQEMEKQALQVKDAKSQKEVSAQQKASQQAQAREQYSLSTYGAGVRLSRARQALEKAKKELEEFREKSGVSTESSSIEKALEKSCEEKREAYIEAEQELSQLQWKIENEVYLAQQNAGTGAVLTDNGTVRTQAAGEPEAEDLSEIELIISEEPYVENSASAGTGSGAAGVGSSADTGAAGGVNIEIVGLEEEEKKATDPVIEAQEAGGDTALDGAGTLGGLEENGTTDPVAQMPDGGGGIIVEDVSDILDAAEEEAAGNANSIGENGAENTDGPGKAGAGNADGTGKTGAENTDGAGKNEAGNGDSTGKNGVENADGIGKTGAENADGAGKNEVENADGAGKTGAEITDSTGERVPGSTDGAGDGIQGNPDLSGTDATLTQEELDRIESSVRDSYSQALNTAKEKVEAAQEAKEEAEAALAQYQAERLAAAETDNAASEKQLIANVSAAQQTYEDAAIAANEAAVTSGRAVQQAGIPAASDSTDRMNEITYEQMELRLEKLEDLKEADGKIYALSEGLVTKVNITTGEKTTDTTAILMADLSKGYRFTAEITKEQEQYIGTGDLVTLTGGSRQKLEELPVESVTADETDTNTYCVTVQLPDDTLEIGMTATLEFSKKTEAYPICVPLSALHLDEKNQAYVLVPDEYETIMGTELKARKVSVTVLEKNESYAALAEGTLTAEQKVIVSSDKVVDEGSRVRIRSEGE